MSQEHVCPSCQTILGTNATKCECCRVFVAGYSLGKTATAARPRIHPLVLIGILLGLCSVWTFAPAVLPPRAVLPGSAARPPVAPASPAPVLKAAASLQQAFPMAMPKAAPARALPAPQGTSVAVDGLNVRLNVSDGPDGPALNLEGNLRWGGADESCRGHVSVRIGDGAPATPPGPTAIGPSARPRSTLTATADEASSFLDGSFSIDGIEFKLHGVESTDDEGRESGHATVTIRTRQQ